MNCNGYTDSKTPRSDLRYSPGCLASHFELDNLVNLVSSLPFHLCVLVVNMFHRHIGPMITYMAKAASDITKWSLGPA